jgi:hypothetical protein
MALGLGLGIGLDPQEIFVGFVDAHGDQRV